MRLCEARQQWRNLVDVLARRIAIESDKSVATELSLTRTDILEERLGAPDEAVRALEPRSSPSNPTHLGMHARLRHLYEMRGDVAEAVRIAERELYLARSPAVKVARGLEIAMLSRDKLGDPKRALGAFERVLELDQQNLEALRGAADLYAKTGAWDKHVVVLEALVEEADPGRDRRALALRIAEAMELELGNPRGAFEWLRRAHEQDPDAGDHRGAAPGGRGARPVRRAGRRLRGRARQGRQPAVVCGGVPRARGRAGAPPARSAAGARGPARRPRAVAGRRRPARRGRACGRGEPAPEERRRHGRPQLARDLRHAPRAAQDAGPAARAPGAARAWREDRLKDPGGALDEQLRAFSLAPDRPELRDEILRLAELAKRFEDALACEATLFARAPTPPERFAIALRAAALVEDKVGDKIRAFRAYLRAFRLRPDDSEVTGNLWRLAKAIGDYPKVAPAVPRRAPAVRPAAPEPVSVVPGLALDAPAAAPPPDSEIPYYVPPASSGKSAPPAPRAPTPAPEADTTDFEKEERSSEHDEEIWGDGLTPAPRDPTIELRIGDLKEMIVPTRPARADQTMELSGGDLASMVVSSRVDSGLPGVGRIESGRPARADDTNEISVADLVPIARPLTPPPPPPPRPSAPPPPVVAALPPPPRPSVFRSAWEEFAHAYETLPVGNLGARLRWAYRAAELWERGPGDLPRAFETLERALAAKPDDAETRARLERLAEEHQAWPMLSAMYERLVERSRSREVAAAMMLEVGRVREIEGKSAEAEEQYRAVIGMTGDAQARGQLETLFVVQERWANLASSMEERANPHSEETTAEEPPRSCASWRRYYDQKLSRPYEAVGALERVRELRPDDEETVNAIAALYERLGRWAKAVEALQRVADMTPAPARAYAARRRVAEIFRTELELPERAIDAWAELAVPGADGSGDALGALAALNSLYEASARWEELADVLQRRASLAPREERPQLLRRRAHVLSEWLSRSDEAASGLREARALAEGTPLAGELAEELVKVLTLGGRHDEAALVLEERARALAADKASPGEQAGIHVRLAMLRARELDDFDGARADLERALALVPDHPNALAELTRLSREREDPRGFAEARAREGAATRDDSKAVEALLEAGATYRDQVGDLDAARGCFKKALERDPGNAEATWALAALASNGGNVEEAAQILEKRLDSELDGPERARVLTELSALAARAGAPAVAERRLEQALEAHANLAAAIALADLLDGSDGKAPDAGGTTARPARWQDLAEFGQQILPKLLAQPGLDTAALAGLYRRVARAYDELGRDEDAYAQLLEADRLHHGQVLLKLALGENRYRARRWREAALHLSALADMPDAARWPREVAEGLYHAALAEVRSLRADRAPGLYEAALRLAPDFVPALRAMAELAVEKGDDVRGVELMRRQAEATGDPAERVRLFEAVGDLARVKLHDEAQARACYQGAVNAAAPLETRHVPLLEKLAALARQAGDLAGAARALELLAAFAGDAPTRAGRYRTAAELRMAAGDLPGARDQAARALDAVTDEDGLEVAVEIDTRIGDWEAVAQLLGRTLPKLPAPEAADRRAELWATLGRARMKRGDGRGAVAALEKASELGGADLTVRRDLVTLYQGGAGEAAQAIPHLQALVEAEPLDSGQLRALAKAYVAAGQVARARTLVAVLEALGNATADDRSLVGGALTLPPVGTLGGDEPLGTLEPAARTRLLGEPVLTAAEELLATLFEASSALLDKDEIGDGLGSLGVALEDRILPTADHALARAYPHVLKTLGVNESSSTSPAALTHRTSAWPARSPRQSPSARG